MYNSISSYGQQGPMVCGGCGDQNPDVSDGYTFCCNKSLRTKQEWDKAERRYEAEQAALLPTPKRLTKAVRAVFAAAGARLPATTKAGLDNAIYHVANSEFRCFWPTEAQMVHLRYEFRRGQRGA